ncbi:MAG TPA: CHAD domain-containing protein [Candidatus Binataceae bacterium]|nr:CHAD domain-containing protein [Candidatus Binataceae bacterium]
MAAALDPATAPIAPHAPVVKLSGGDVATAARALLKGATEAVGLNYAGALGGDDEAVHQYRIGTRRLRAAIMLFQPVLYIRWVNRTCTELKVVGHTVGAIRDNDVLRQTLDEASAQIEPSFRAALTPVRDALITQRRAQHHKAAERLTSARYLAMVERIPLAPVKKSAASVTVDTLLPEVIRPLWRKLERAGSKLDADSPPAEFHRLRIKIKRLRYALEMIEPGEMKQTIKAVKRLKEMQDKLGVQHDLAAAAVWLHESATAGALPTDTLLAAGALYQVLHRRGLKLARQAWKGWKKLERSGIIQETLDEIARRAQTPAHESDTVNAA